jgi:hypothetical protein
VRSQIQDDEEIQHVKFEMFERFMVKVMVEREYEPAHEEVILQAFKVCVRVLVPLACVARRSDVRV